MRVLKHHYKGNNTIIGFGHIQNGCQLFTKDEANVVFYKYDIPEEIQVDVITILAEETEKEKDLDISQCPLISNTNVRDFLSMIGIKEHLYLLVYDDDWWIRTKVAKHNHKDLLDVLVRDSVSEVRREVAKHNHKEHLNILIGDEIWEVRREVAKHNHKDLLDILVYDDSWWIREEVAKHKHKDLLDILVKDVNFYVQNQTEKTLKEMGY